MNGKERKSTLMSNGNVDLTLVFRKKHTPPPSVLLLALPKDSLPNEIENKHRLSPAAQLRSQQRKSREGTHTVGLHHHETLSKSSFQWQRYSDRMSQVMPAPDVAYKNTYLDNAKHDIAESNLCSSNSPSPRTSSQSSGQLATAHSSLRSSRQRYTTDPSHSVYDHLRQSLRQLEQQRNTKQQNISVRIKRPQNEDQTFRRALAEKKSSARSTLSRSSLRTASTSRSKLSSINQDLDSAQSFVNYINYSRFFQTAVPNHSYQ